MFGPDGYAQKGPSGHPPALPNINALNRGIRPDSMRASIGGDILNGGGGGGWGWMDGWGEWAAVGRPVDRARYSVDRAMPCRVAPDRAAGAILGHPRALK